MTLNERDGQLFYQLWLPILDYVNDKYHVNKKLKNIAKAKSLDPVEVKKVANYLWENGSVIEEYLEERGKGICDEHKQIILGWKNCVQGRFLMERHLKNGTIFVGEDNCVYQVLGIVSSWKEMFQFAQLPLFVEATFIPFRDKIISDGLVSSYPIFMGKGVKSMLKDTYMEAKKNGTIIRSFDTAFISATKKKAFSKKKWKKFSDMKDLCYASMVGDTIDDSCWGKTFELLMNLIAEERAENPQFASRLELIDDDTDYKYDIQGWLEDCLDEVELQNDFALSAHMCDCLLETFAWEDGEASQFKFSKTFSLLNTGKTKEAKAFSEQWMQEEPDNIVAATAYVSACMQSNDYKRAERIINNFIPDKKDCNDENFMMYSLLPIVYEQLGKKKEKKMTEKVLDEFNVMMEELFMMEEFGDDDFDEDDWDDDFLPFS